MSLVFLALAFGLLLLSLLTPASLFAGAGPVAEGVYTWGLFALSLVFLFLFTAYRGRR